MEDPGARSRTHRAGSDPRSRGRWSAAGRCAPRRAVLERRRAGRKALECLLARKPAARNAAAAGRERSSAAQATQLGEERVHGVRELREHQHFLSGVPARTSRMACARDASTAASARTRARRERTAADVRAHARQEIARRCGGRGDELWKGELNRVLHRAPRAELAAIGIAPLDNALSSAMPRAMRRRSAPASAARLDAHCRSKLQVRSAPPAPPSDGGSGGGSASSSSRSDPSSRTAIHSGAGASGIAIACAMSLRSRRTMSRASAASLIAYARAPRNSAKSAASSARRLCTGVAVSRSTRAREASEAIAA